MQKLNKRSGSSLFLMEMILSILILALACTAWHPDFRRSRHRPQKSPGAESHPDADCFCRRNSGGLDRKSR